MINDVSLTCDTSLEIFHDEFNRLSNMDNDLFTYEVEIAGIANVPCDLNKDGDSKQQMSQESDDDMEYDPSDVEGDNEVVLTDEESSDSDDEDEVAKIFRIETNVFDFETPLYRAFKEFNYLLHIDPDVLTNDIEGFKLMKNTWMIDKKHFKTLSLDESRSLDFDLFFDQFFLEEEVAETMAKTMEQYMSKTQADYGSRITRPKIKDKNIIELKGQFLKELRDNTFSSSDHEDANEHIEKVLKIVDLFHIPNITIDQVMLRAFPMSLMRAASRWLRNKLSGLISTWEDLKTKFLSKYCPPARTA
ncbi:hypothetical protein Tco_1431009 [Tanacetum coccineum]